MRILKIVEAKRANIDFIYKEGNCLAIVDKDFDKKYEIMQRK